VGETVNDAVVVGGAVVVDVEDVDVVDVVCVTETVPGPTGFEDVHAWSDSANAPAATTRNIKILFRFISLTGTRLG